jgi:hypothetical protein
MRFEATTQELLEEYRREIEAVVETAKLRAQSGTDDRLTSSVEQPGLSEV